MGSSSHLAVAPIAPEQLLGAFMAEVQGAGAVVTFSGVARPLGAAGGSLQRLHLQHYPGMTEASLQRIAQAATERFDVSNVHVVHRCGDIAPGETIVFVAAASRHRRAAFEAADYMMDRLKTEAVFWKREDGPDGARWIEPTDTDHEDAARWEK